MSQTSLLKKKLGDLLVEVGIITSEQLKEAIEEQKTKGGKLGQILISKGYITEDVLLAFLGRQCRWHKCLPPLVTGGIRTPDAPIMIPLLLA